MGIDPTPAAGPRRQPQLAFDEQLDRIAALIRLAGGEALSVREFNRLRGEHDPTLPTAQAACARYRLSWADVRQLAATPAARRGAFHGVKTSERDDYDFGREEAIAILKSVAHSLGKTPDRTEYDAEANRRIKRSKRGGLPPAAIPHSQTIANNMGGWAEALAVAGLDPLEHEFGKGSPHPGCRPAAELVDEFVTEHGLLPICSYFEDWCRAKDIPLGRDSRDWRAVVAEVRRIRGARGESTPAELTHRAGLPELPTPTSGTRRRAKRHTREAAIASLRLFGKRHLQGGRATTRAYRAAALTDDELMPLNSVMKFGKWGDLRQEAGI
jgi:hypothetical protein